MLCKEWKRNQIQNWFKGLLVDLPELQRKQLINISQKTFMEQLMVSDFLCLLGGVVVILLFRYGYKGFLKFAHLDQSVRLLTLIDIIKQNVSEADAALLHKQPLQTANPCLVSHPYQVLLVTNLSAEQQCSLLGTIIYIFVIQIGFNRTGVDVI